MVTTTQTPAESVTARGGAGAMGTANGGMALPVSTEVNPQTKPWGNRMVIIEEKLWIKFDAKNFFNLLYFLSHQT